MGGDVCQLNLLWQLFYNINVNHYVAHSQTSTMLYVNYMSVFFKGDLKLLCGIPGAIQPEK